MSTGQPAPGRPGVREAPPAPGLPAPLLCVEDAEAAAVAVLTRDVADFVTGGSGRELTLAANRAALDAVALVPRVLNDVSGVDAATDLFGAPATMPVATAPMAFQQIVHPDGEMALARAARDAGIPFTISILSSYPLEEIAALGGVSWFQIYWLRDRDQLAGLIRRAEQAGCGALLLSVDVPRMGRRLRDLRNGYALAPGIVAANLTGEASALQRARVKGRSGPATHTSKAMDPSLNWDDVTWLAGLTRLPLVLKGILDPRDAARAADAGVAGIVVSNHGGRQLDGAIASAAALPGVADAVAGRCAVLLDGGIRGGIDVLKALALGADGVLLGRSALWGLASGGEAGARAVLRLLQEELLSAMALAGCPDLTAARCLSAVMAAPALVDERRSR